MMIKKRFNIVSSEIVEGGKFIQDNNKEYSFPTTIYPSSLVMYEKVLNKLSGENEQLKQKIEDLEFALRTELAYQRVEKEKYSDTVHDFEKKLEKW